MDSPYSPQHSMWDAINSPPSIGSIRRSLKYPATPDEQDTQSLLVRTAASPRASNARKLVWTSLLKQQLATVLYLVPVGSLLVMNLRGYIIGAGAWCPEGHCHVDPFKDEDEAIKYTLQNHNLLGVLQLVAKALEIWFFVIAAKLVYLVLASLVSRKEGLPLVYLTRAAAFGDLLDSCEKTLWRTLPPLAVFRHPRGTKERPELLIWGFMLFTGALGLLCNLMGPATAVLALPSLQWRNSPNTPSVGDQVFTGINNAEPPMAADSRFSWQNLEGACNNTSNFNQRQYSCNGGVWATHMEAMLETYYLSKNSEEGNILQGSVSFTLNVSIGEKIKDIMNWTPSRQALHMFVEDQHILKGELSDTTPNEVYSRINQTIDNAQQAYLQRKGPIMAATTNMWLAYNNQSWRDFDAGISPTGSRSVRCFYGYNLSDNPFARGELSGEYTKCVQRGEGWGGYLNTSFVIGGMWSYTSQYYRLPVVFDIWNSAKAVFLPSGSAPDPKFGSCLTDNQSAPADDCDWEALFDFEAPANLGRRNVSTTTIQMTQNRIDDNGHPQPITLAVDFVAFQAFVIYSLDPSIYTNPLGTVTYSQFPVNTERLTIHPAWLLYAFSADEGKIMGPDEAVFLQFARAFDAIWASKNDDQPLWEMRRWIDALCLVPVVQTLSLIDWNSEPASTSQLEISDDHPLLTMNTRIYVWAYGMSSRTSILGAVVAICGCIVAVVEFVLGCLIPRKGLSPMELLVAALEYTYNAEFERKDEKEIARVRYRLEDRFSCDGKVRFRKVD